MFFDEIYAHFKKMKNEEKEEIGNIVVSYLETIADQIKDKEYIQNKIKDIKNIKIETIVDVQEIHKIMLRISLDSTDNKGLRMKHNLPINSDPWSLFPRAKEFVENFKRREPNAR